MVVTFSFCALIALVFANWIETFIKSLIISSTSFPLNPNSVYFVASTFKNGVPANFAIRFDSSAQVDAY